MNDDVPTPPWLMKLFKGFFDLYPLGSSEPANPPDAVDIYANPGYSRVDAAVDRCIQLNDEGHYVAMLIPMESSTQRAKKVIQHGCYRIYFERRVYDDVRGVELVILDNTARTKDSDNNAGI